MSKLKNPKYQGCDTSSMKFIAVLQSQLDTDLIVFTLTSLIYMCITNQFKNSVYEIVMLLEIKHPENEFSN